MTACKILNFGLLLTASWWVVCGGVLLLVVRNDPLAWKLLAGVLLWILILGGLVLIQANRIKLFPAPDVKLKYALIVIGLAMISGGNATELRVVHNVRPADVFGETYYLLMAGTFIILASTVVLSVVNTLLWERKARP